MLSADRSLGVHGDQAKQLQQVVLDHVAQLAGLVEVAPAAFDTDLFGHGDLHVGDGVLVPLGFEQAVGETQGDQVLHRLFAQVVVDAIDAVFREERATASLTLRDDSRSWPMGFSSTTRVFSPGRPFEVLADRPIHRAAWRSRRSVAARLALAQPGLT
jgi:hypothetical protein